MRIFLAVVAALVLVVVLSWLLPRVFTLHIRGWRYVPFVTINLLLSVALVLASVGMLASYPGEEIIPANLSRNSSYYITMRDSIDIAVDVWLPANLQPDQRVPTIIEATRYVRAYQPGIGLNVLVGLNLSNDPNLSREIRAFNEAGYAVLLMDSRGSGASFGRRSVEWSPDEVADFGEVADWIVSQSWSNGKVGGWGISYTGNTAELLAVPNHPAVKAVAPLYSDFDPLANLAMPGGVLNEGFIRQWSEGNNATDQNDFCAIGEINAVDCFLQNLLITGIKPVDGERHRLEAAVADHHDNYDVFEALSHMTYFDEPIQDSNLTREDISPFGLKEEIESSGVAMYVRVGWLDAATVNFAISRYLTFSNRQVLEIGPWNHGGDHHIDPFLPADTLPDPPVDQQLTQLIRFFDTFLKTDDPPEFQSYIRYYTMNGGGWQTAEVWPPTGIEDRLFYFAPDNMLTNTPPTDTNASDQYTVDFSATTGDATRWDTQSDGSDVIYPDRSEESTKLLTYTTEPLETDVEFTGVPIVTLQVSSTATDGAFYAYLEDVAPDGRVTYITEGVMRGLHRKTSSETPPYTVLGPYHTFHSDDSAPLVPGEVTQIDITLSATSVRLEEGHRIRISIAGHDNSTFARIPADETPTLTIHRDQTHASFVTLPLKILP
ncbi:MAG: CocE/NonD family hydrolase [Chloroflexi bacterium AL-W]|nr:CocE/NonD family hydrolase [Chloroflexi bacterium AL-N1]NOK66784.1 CocE/NonD family hydrolase [Chloroflexi bacterium AL-N10]NOK74924.1 CocE/NonD family hydrolase [Chloroflexi bacterium AL-N5]NOK81387.1 CocE/NonD family hydrolase [Chloroflexi bacterium AL-W]NOK88856.1 CocE/NonD family hydrolase [Chloroflexi bacterium AL-N15]